MLELRNLRRSFGDVTALDGVSFTVAEGDMVGFVGPNGAGQDHGDAHRTGGPGTRRRRGAVARPAGRRRGAAAVRLHPGGTWALPEDARDRSARASGPAPRGGEAGCRSEGHRDPRRPRHRGARPRPGGVALVGQPATCAARRRAGARSRGAGARRAVLGPRPGGGRRAGGGASPPGGRTMGRPWCSPATSSTWSSGSATRWC